MSFLHRKSSSASPCWVYEGSAHFIPRMNPASASVMCNDVFGAVSTDDDTCNFNDAHAAAPMRKERHMALQRPQRKRGI